MQQLRDKLAVAERTAKAEAHLKVRKLMIFMFPVFPNFSFETYLDQVWIEPLYRKSTNCVLKFWKKGLVKYPLMALPAQTQLVEV